MLEQLFRGHALLRQPLQHAFHESDEILLLSSRKSLLETVQRDRRDHRVFMGDPGSYMLRVSTGHQVQPSRQENRALTTGVKALPRRVTARDKLARRRPDEGDHAREVSERVVAALGVEDVSEQMRPLEEIPDLFRESADADTSRQGRRPRGRASHQSANIPNVNGAAPRHLEDDLGRPVNVRLDKWAGLMRTPYPCLAQVAQYGKPKAFADGGWPKLSARVDGPRLVHLLSRTGFSGLCSGEISQHSVVLEAEHQIVRLQVCSGQR